MRNTLSQASYALLDAPITVKEIENVIFTSNISKVPGVDGLNAGFFRACWPIVKMEVTNAILNFF